MIRRFLGNLLCKYCLAGIKMGTKKTPSADAAGVIK